MINSLQGQQIVIIDYEMGNIRSVIRKLEKLGANVHCSSLPQVIERADKLILPGVGHFGNGIKKLYELHLFDALNEAVIVKQKPVLGICLGMQLMAGFGQEGNCAGLGWFDADVLRFEVSNRLKFKVPHIGWNNVSTLQTSYLLRQIPEQALFYFVHSYHFHCHNQTDSKGQTNYDYSFTSVVEKDNIFGTQFHPEKSQEWGDALLRNFLKI